MTAPVITGENKQRINRFIYTSEFSRPLAMLSVAAHECLSTSRTAQSFAVLSASNLVAASASPHPRTARRDMLARLDRARSRIVARYSP
jgi:hypothetical protein